ncbi:hypothetical protein BRADI_4g09840v3 [Brachypodium distachyon]|uniref:RNase H type-1 domain-containing protein n=1 Tax=Brachypodium distachyon TaxID=15368 RepID=A0A0Q3EHL2_BRADI|nr:hypothetical protein BRADI_4g09840v3 [Brachypodium distachyon]
MRVNIERSGVELDTRSVVCNSLFENGNHLFFECKEVKKRWLITDLEEQRCSLAACSSAMEVGHAIVLMPMPTAIKVVALLWCWWTERNKANRGEHIVSLNEFQATVMHFLLDWQSLMPNVKNLVSKPVFSWKRPPTEFVKINIDGAFDAGTGHGGWGCLARDSDGDIVFAAAGYVEHAAEALQTEAHAFIRGILCAENLGIGRIIMETDCQILQRAVSSSEYDASPLACSVPVLPRNRKQRLSLGGVRDKSKRNDERKK